MGGGSKIWTNLSAPSMSFGERAYILPYIFKKQEIDSVIASLDIYTYLDLQEYLAGGGKGLQYLYVEKPFNNIKIYINFKFLKCLSTFSNDEKCIGKKNSLEHFVKYDYGNFYKDKNYSKNPELYSNSSYIKDINLSFPSPYSNEKIATRLKKSMDYMEKYLLHNARENPNTKFLLVFPPYYRLEYLAWKYNGKLAYGNNDIDSYYETHLAFIKAIALESSKYQNLKIYGFEDMDFLSDINNYLDNMHGKFTTDSIWLDSIASGKALLTPKNVDSYIATSRQKLIDYEKEFLRLRAVIEENEKNRSK